MIIIYLFKTTSAKGTYRFAYRNNKTLVSYRSENDKTILLLFSSHSEDEINKMENKSEIVLQYKKLWELVIHLCYEYTVSQKIHR